MNDLKNYFTNNDKICKLKKKYTYIINDININYLSFKRAIEIQYLFNTIIVGMHFEYFIDFCELTIKLIIINYYNKLNINCPTNVVPIDNIRIRINQIPTQYYNFKYYCTRYQLIQCYTFARI